MDENQKPEALADKVVSDINRDFSVVGKTRIHSWYAWAMVGVCVGMFSGILYVANRSVQFDRGVASNREGGGEVQELVFLSPENNSSLNTNPVLRVRSLNKDGSPSLAPLQFSYALEGSEEFNALPVHYHVSQFTPGVHVAIPDIFTEKIDFNEEEREITFTEAVPEGRYTIRVSRQTTEEPGFTAQAVLDKPLLPTPPAYASFSFVPPAPSWRCGTGFCFGANNAPFCGVEKMELIQEGPETEENPTGTIMYGKAYVYKFIFQIRAHLTPGSTPSACAEGQQVKLTMVSNSDSPDEDNDIYHPVRYPGQNQAVPGSTINTAAFSGGPFSDILNQTSISGLPVKLTQRCPVDGVEYCPDDFNAPAAGVKWYFSDLKPPLIKWEDSPGIVVLDKNLLPATFEAKFKHYITGSPKTGGTWKYNFQTGKVMAPGGGWFIPIYTPFVYSIPEKPAGKSAICGSQLRITAKLDEWGKSVATYDMTDNCASATSGGGPTGGINPIDAQ